MGVRALAEALKGNGTLVMLYLGSVGDEGERALAKALKKNPNLIAAPDIGSLAQTSEGGLSID